MKITTKKVLFVLLIIAVSIAFYLIKKSNLSVEAVDWDSYKQLYEDNRFLVSSVYFLVYVAVTAFSLPAATLLTLAAGILFGLWQGMLLVSFASSIGASLAFLVARYFLQEELEAKYPDKYKTINQKIEKDGIIYLLILRLIPLVPFFVVNLLMGITKLKLWKFYIGSQIGMLPGTFIYVNAGATLSTLRSFTELYTPKVLISIGLIVVLILATNIITKRMKKK